MPISSFKDLIVWQKAFKLTSNIYKEFSGLRDFGFRDQIQRASIFIMNNIAEGYGKRSDKSLNNYLVIALGSAAEVESMILISTELRYISHGTQQQLLMELTEVSKLLNAFRKKLKVGNH